MTKKGTPERSLKKLLAGVSGLLDRLTFGIDVHDADRQALQDFAIATDVYRVDASIGETQALEIEDQVASEERNIRWQCDVEFWLDRHVGGIERGTVFINDVDGELVATAVFGSKAETQCQGAMGMHDGQRTSGKGIKNASYHQFALVVGCEVTEGSNLNVHRI